MSSAGQLSKLFADFGDDVQFFLIYCREAHPIDGKNPGAKTVVEGPVSDEERRDVARKFVADMGLEIPALLDGWRSGAKVVWAARRARLGESRSTILFARIYYWIMRNTAGMRDMPASGADFFLLDRAVIDALKTIDDKNTSIMGLITWLGFDQQVVEYDKQARMHGETGWTFSKKLKLAIDSIAGFSYFPIRFISLVGLVIAFCGFIAAAVVVYNAVITDLVTGWASIMVALLVLNGLQMLMLGVLGEYIWRGLDETRNRPKYIVQEKVNAATDAPKKQK